MTDLLSGQKEGFRLKYDPIITVGRQYGSGGRYVAKLLAEKLNIPYYDKELLAEAAKDSGICRDVLEEYVYGYAAEPQNLSCPVRHNTPHSG